MAKKPSLLLTVGSLQEWHRWLQLKGRKETGVWLVFYRKASGQAGLSYEDAVEEALCYGWIDSLVKRLDDERFAHLFTPRKDPKKWSASNLERMKRMIEAGRMTRDGLAVLDRSIDLERLPDPAEAKRSARAAEPELPPAYLARIRRDPAARSYFDGLAPSHRRDYVRWILTAAREETRLRRLDEAIERLARQEKLGPK